MFDFSILILQMFFSDIEESLYGILLVMIYTFVLDKVLVIGTHQARADIVSSHYEEIRQAIFTRLDRGCTLLNATTGYLQTDQPVLMTVVSRREMASLNQIVMEIDPHAFLIISDANEVKGSGFTSTKSIKRTRTSDQFRVFSTISSFNFHRHQRFGTAMQALHRSDRFQTSSSEQTDPRYTNTM